MNYFVSSYGHLAFFVVYEDATAFKAEFGGEVFNLWGLRYGKAAGVFQ